MSILWTIIIGFVAGVIAKFLMPGKNEPSGFILTTILGIVGAFVATFLGQALGFYRSRRRRWLYWGRCGRHRRARWSGACSPRETRSELLPAAGPPDDDHEHQHAEPDAEGASNDQRHEAFASGASRCEARHHCNIADTCATCSTPGGQGPAHGSRSTGPSGHRHPADQ